MDVDEDYDEVFEFWIPGVCLSGKICVHRRNLIILIFLKMFCNFFIKYFRNLPLGIYWQHSLCCYFITVRMNEFWWRVGLQRLRLVYRLLTSSQLNLWWKPDNNSSVLKSQLKRPGHRKRVHCTVILVLMWNIRLALVLAGSSDPTDQFPVNISINIYIAKYLMI